MKNLLLIILAVILTACGAGSQETTVSEPQTETIDYDFKINKDFKTDTWQMYEIDFKDESTYLCLKIKWVDEFGMEDSKDYFNGSYDLIIYFPYQDLSYSVFNYNTKEVYEEGMIQ